MASDDEIQNALLAIHSRLGTIEGKVNLVARAEREKILAIVEAAMRDDPLLGQIYLLLDGKRTQTQIIAELKKYDIVPSQPTVSRRMTDIVTEFGLADAVEGGAATVLRKNRASEDVLNLSRRVRRWLAEEKQPIPEKPVRRPRRSAE